VKHARADYNERIQDQAGEIPVDEPVFLLRGQDELASRTVKFYAGMMMQAGADVDAIQAVTRQAQAMHLWPHRKMPDVPQTLAPDEATGEALERQNDVSRETLSAAESRFHGMLAGVVVDFIAYLTGEGADTFAQRLTDVAPDEDDPNGPVALNTALALVEGMKDWAAARMIDDRRPSDDWKSKLYPRVPERALDQ
jgi:hypothetical protein